MSKESKEKGIVYFDNNATGIPIPDKVIADITYWLKNGFNPSTDSKLATPVKEMIQNAVDGILTSCDTNKNKHTLLFTSGATESNCFIIRSCVKAYEKKLKDRGVIGRPHLVVSRTEHSSVLECVSDLLSSESIEVTFVEPTIYGNIPPESVEKSIKPWTCLICIMFANNEIPIINDIKSIGKIAEKHNIPLHCDCVQVFGKYKINMKEYKIDSLSASAHKFYGPKGIGLLIINNELIEGYELTAEINGSQQHHLRGGTENVAGIAGLYRAFTIVHQDREKKNKHLLKLREYTLKKLAECFPFGEYKNYVTDKKNIKDLEIVNLGPPNGAFLLPNTILLAVCKNKGKAFCNIQLKKYLDSKLIIVSIGSACNTSSPTASHVLKAILAPPEVRQGVLRISFGDENTEAQIDKFIEHFVKGVNAQLEKEIFDKKKEKVTKKEK